MMMFDRTQPNLRKQLAKPVEPICQSKSARIGGYPGVYFWNGEKARILWVLTLNQRILSIERRYRDTKW